MDETQNTEEAAIPAEAEVKPVFPSEYEIVMNILDQYKKQLNAASTKTEEAIEKLRKNLRNAEDSNIAILAQRKLVEALGKDLAKLSGK